MDHGFLPAARDGSVARSTNPVWHAAAPGDYLPPTPAGGIPAVLLGFSDAVRSRTFYAEAVRPSEETGDLRILFEVKPDERAGFIAADAVRATAVQMEFIIPDENGGKLPTRFVPVSEPRPVVALADLENEDVDIAGGT